MAPGAPRILHIEDDPAAQRLVERVLGAAGMEVRTVADGLAGVSGAVDWKPDLVLVDINVPSLDGYEIALRLRSEPGLGDVPIVAITAEGERALSLAVGFDGFFQKPIDVSRFSGAILEYLGGRRDGDAAAGSPLLRPKAQRIVRRLEEKIRALEDARDRLEATRKARDEFYRNVTHELMTPLTPIMGFLRLLAEERIGPLSPSQREAVAGATKAAGRMCGLLTGLVDISALALGKVVPTPGPFRVSEALGPLAAEMSERCEGKGIRFQADLPGETVVFVGDRERIPRVFRQLLDNSIKFTPAGGAVLFEVRVDAERLTGYVVDTGIGVPAAEQRRIFEAFYQVDGSVTRAHGGMGVGLAVARDFLHLMGGEVWIESPPRSRTIASPEPDGPGSGEPSRGGALFGVRIPTALPRDDGSGST